jgi:hypothetical protein
MEMRRSGRVGTSDVGEQINLSYNLKSKFGRVFVQMSIC